MGERYKVAKQDEGLKKMFVSARKKRAFYLCLSNWRVCKIYVNFSEMKLQRVYIKLVYVFHSGVNLSTWTYTHDTGILNLI